ncbi:MAG TPA: GNAT family protein [Mycobacterium sp.]|nr:GNAT family protein [Mycobacterium sp.]
MTGFLEPVALAGERWVSLEPLTPEHAPEIATAALDVRPLWFTSAPTHDTECKLLMLSHAFDELGCVAVEFRTHSFNSTSRAAIERLGAKQDGILRSHQLLPDGSRRDTVVYSILDVEWPSVRNNLRFRLDR